MTCGQAAVGGCKLELTHNGPCWLEGESAEDRQRRIQRNVRRSVKRAVALDRHSSEFGLRQKLREQETTIQQLETSKDAMRETMSGANLEARMQASVVWNIGQAIKNSFSDRSRLANIEAILATSDYKKHLKNVEADLLRRLADELLERGRVTITPEQLRDRADDLHRPYH